MKRLTRLKLKAAFWLAPWFVLFIPWIILEETADRCAKAAGWLDSQLTEISYWLAGWMPPKWWPSHKLKREIEEELHRLSVERRTIRTVKKALSPSGEGEGGNCE